MIFDRRWLLPALAAVLLIAAACGDDDDDAGSTPTDDTTPTATATATATAAPTETSTPEPTEAPGDAVQRAAIVDFTHVSITVAVGDTVRWTNGDDAPHTTTSSDGDWDSGTLANGGTFENTFTTAGAFAYVCTIHSSMTGTITVE
jgi:plastocyanin